VPAAEPLVRAHVGGKDARRSELSDLALALDLVREFEAFRRRLFDLVEVEFSQRPARQRSKSTAANETIEAPQR